MSSKRNRKPYSPKAGSLAEQVVQHLQALGAGATLEFREIGRLFDKRRNNIEPCLRAAIEHGTLVRTGPAVVRLGAAGETIATTEHHRAVPDAPRKISRRGAAGRRNANQARRAAQPERARAEATPAPAPAGPVACLWDDGDVVLHGLEPNADGVTATITELHARRLHAFLDRLYGMPVASLASDGSYRAQPPGRALLTHDEC